MPINLLSSWLITCVVTCSLLVQVGHTTPAAAALVLAVDVGSTELGL